MTEQVKLWHDDIRRAPDDTWMWARTNDQAQEILEKYDVVEASLDHDMGLHDEDPDAPGADLQTAWDEENDGYKLVIWMCHENKIPPKVTIHSWNPAGAKRMHMRLKMHGCDPLMKPLNSSDNG